MQQVKSQVMEGMRYCFVMEDMEMYSISRPMPWGPMLQPLGERTSAVPSLQTHRSHKSTQLVFLYRETISQN